MKILVAGAAGFIGSNFVRRLLAAGGHEVVVLDSLTYAGNMENLAGLDASDGFSFVHGSICDPAAVKAAVQGCEAIVNFAAETHVDRSIENPAVFIESNVLGAMVLIQAAVGAGLRLLQVSTDEVYGSLGEDGLFDEDWPLDPSSPYAASKASADMLIGASARTYGLDAVITRCGNNYGPRQFPEKLIPLLIANAMADETLPIYGDGLNVRDWIHVDDHCEALRLVLEKGQSGRVYNVSAVGELTNREVCSRILAALGKPESLMRHVDDRPGHDRRYALDPSRLQNELGWKADIAFDDGLSDTIKWYQANRAWLDNVRSGEYRGYYERMYASRLESGTPVAEGD